MKKTASKKYPLRGEIWIANLDPRMGTEIGKTRPVFVLSNNHSNKHLSRVQAVPITSNTEKLYPCEFRIKNRKVDGKAMADQIITLDKQRLMKKVVACSPVEVLGVEQVVKLQLGL